MSNLPALTPPPHPHPARTPHPAPADLIADLVPDPLDPLLTRPLALHNGRAYAAVWPLLHHPAVLSSPVQADDPAAPDLSPPSPTLLLVRDDGLLSHPVSPADVLVRLASLPPLPADRLWTTAGLQAYCAGRRPDPAQVFAHLTAIFDRFVDFTGCLADQSLMPQVLAAYVLATWFLPAFSTFSHLWILGDTGAGKSRLLHLLTRLCHLGAVVPAFAATGPLRDLAALGATLAVDNADGLYHSLTKGLAFRPAAATLRQGLFLAGARRDVLFPLHQRLAGPTGPAAYGLTHLDVFGPRLFAAQQPPPPAAAARALYLSLLRSTDRARCLADPADTDSSRSAWPVQPRALTDDLWALALAHLAELPAHIAAVAARSNLVGAAFQTWQPLFAVAAWLAAHGLSQLEDRFRQLAREYNARTVNIAPQAADLTSLALHAIYGYVAHEVAEVLATVPEADRYADAPRGGSSGRSGSKKTPPRCTQRLPAVVAVVAVAAKKIPPRCTQRLPAMVAVAGVAAKKTPPRCTQRLPAVVAVVAVAANPTSAPARNYLPCPRSTPKSLPPSGNSRSTSPPA